MTRPTRPTDDQWRTAIWKQAADLLEGVDFSTPRGVSMNNETRAEWDREVYDHERMTGQHADNTIWTERDDPDEYTLATWTIQVVGPALTEIETRFSLTDKRVLANLPAMLEAVEEDLNDLLPDGYSATIKDWSSDE